LVLSAVIALLLIGVLGSGLLSTGAYYSDTETSTGNSFTAGTLDLKVDGKDDPDVVHLVRTDLKPNPAWSHSYGGQWVLKNAGTLPGRFSMQIVNIKNYENTCIEPETGDTTCDVGPDQGELGSIMYGKWLRNQAPWGGWGSVFNPINSAAGMVVTGDILAPGSTVNAYLDLEFDTHPTGDNLAQSDSLELDIVFSLVQEP